MTEGREDESPSTGEQTDQGTALRTVSTGIASLNTLLRGGVPAYAVVIVAGAPGTGKTILVQQMLFATAKRGQRALYLTTLSESPMKAARYQSQFSFFDPEMFGEEVAYLDIGQVIRAQGMEQALASIAEILRNSRPAMVAIDSFKAIHDLAPSALQMREFIFDLSVELTAVRSTSIWVGEYSAEDLVTMPEMAVADGIIWLTSQIKNDELMREIRVLKMRGVDHDTAEHSFAITNAGIDIFALDGLRPTLPPSLIGQVTKTGLPELDDLLQGGIPAGSPVLVTGEAGTGKTTLGMQFLKAGVTEFGEKGFFLSYEEPVEQIVANAAKFGWDFARLMEAGKLQVIYRPLTEIDPQQQILFISRLLKETGAKRAVIDSLTLLMSRVGDNELIRRYLYQLLAVLKNAGCTTLIISDPIPGAGGITRFGVEESIIDGVIVLKSVAERRGRMRYLEIYKLRGVNHASGDNVMKITPHGIEVFPRVEEVR